MCLTCKDSGNDVRLEKLNKSIGELSICGRYIKFYDFEFILSYPSSLGRFQHNFTIEKLACVNLNYNAFALISIDKPDGNLQVIKHPSESSKRACMPVRSISYRHWPQLRSRVVSPLSSFPSPLALSSTALLRDDWGRVSNLIMCRP